MKGHRSGEVARVAEEVIAFIMYCLGLDLTGMGMLMNETAFIAALRGDKRTKRIVKHRFLKRGSKDFLQQRNVPVNMLREEGEEGGE